MTPTWRTGAPVRHLFAADVVDMRGSEVRFGVVVPLMKLEIAATGIVAPGLKIRVGGGFSMPGYHTFGITASYLVPNR